MKARPAVAAPAAGHPEHWRARTATAALLRLDIPPHAGRERVFDIHCSMTVRLREARDDAWHRMVVQANGQLEWERRVSIHNPGASDGLDLHFRRKVPVGEGLRLLVSTDLYGAQRVAIAIEADENGD